MRPAVVVLAAAAALALPASAAGIDGPGVVNFPNVPIEPRQDSTARGYLSPAISTLHTPTFCWELSLFTRAQPLFAYLRRAGTNRVVATIDIRDNHVPPLPWPGSSSYSGCAFITRATERAFLREPGLYYLDVRTQTARHAAVAHPRGPRV
jgi:hypothetical protein